MSTSSASPPEQAPAIAAAPAAKPKVEKVHSYLAVVSTGIGIVGAVGTGFVWLATTFFLGDVQIQPNKPVDSVVVKIIDKRGQGSFYYGKDVQLLPGKYHLEISQPDSKAVQHADVDVKLWKITTVPFNVPEPGAAQAAAQPSADGEQPADAQQSSNEEQPEQSRKHWWQFWKKAR